MKKSILSLTVAAFVLVGAGSSRASTIVNPGFETGNFDGWLHSSLASVVSNADGYTAPSGNYFASLTAPSNPFLPTLVSQRFWMNAGDTLSGYAAFEALDSSNNNDSASAKISLLLGGTTTLYSANVSSVGSYSKTPWTFWQITAQQAGIYTMSYTIRNANFSGQSKAFFDIVSTPVPDSGMTVVLLGFGLISLWVISRRFSPNRG